VDKPNESADGNPKVTVEPGSTQPKQPVTASDPLTSLPEQIDTAPSDQERVVLQLKLVDELVLAGKKQDAVNELHLMAAEDRFDPQTFYNIGNALARLGDSNAAVTTYRKAIEQRKGRYSRALNNLGVVLMRQGRWEEANEAFSAALKLESFRYAEASYNLGRLYAAQGEIDLAIREWHRALTVDPDHKAAAQAIAGASFDGRITVTAKPAGDKREVRPITVAAMPNADKREAERADTSPQPKASVANVNVASPARSSSASMMRTLTVDQVTYNQLQRARDARERGKDQEAITSYRSVMSRMRGYFGPANLELSYILIGMKQPDEALTYLRPVTTRDGSRYPISYYHLARIYEFKNQLDLAAEAYEQAAERYKGLNAQFLLDVSRVREKRGDYKGALTAMEEYLIAVERQGLKPNWSEERLAALRQKLSNSQPKQ
jgi:tetratricopeptide (TPR) repeat protein